MPTGCLKTRASISPFPSVLNPSVSITWAFKLDSSEELRAMQAQLEAADARLIREENRRAATHARTNTG